MIKQNPKDPIWTVKLQIPVQHKASVILDGAGQPLAQARPEYGDEQEITVHAPDEKTAGETVLARNPGAKILGAEKASA